MPCVSGRTNETDAMEGDRGRPTVWHKHAQGLAAVANQTIPPPPPGDHSRQDPYVVDRNTAAWLLGRSGLNQNESDNGWKDPRMTKEVPVEVVGNGFRREVLVLPLLPSNLAEE